MNHSTILSTETIFKAKLFTLQASNIQYPSGREVVHHEVYRNPIVSVLPITDTNEIYLIKEYRVLLQKTILSTVAGFIDENEAPLHAAKRELQEETGLQAEQWEHLRTVDIMASVIKAQTHIFLAKGLTFGKAKPEEDEEIELIKMLLDEAVQKVMTGEITTATSIIGILHLDRLLKDRKV